MEDCELAPFAAGSAAAAERWAPEPESRHRPAALIGSPDSMSRSPPVWLPCDGLSGGVAASSWSRENQRLREAMRQAVTVKPSYDCGHHALSSQRLCRHAC